jgi:hypothetical protein
VTPPPAQTPVLPPCRTSHRAHRTPARSCPDVLHPAPQAVKHPALARAERQFLPEPAKPLRHLTLGSRRKKPDFTGEIWADAAPNPTRSASAHSQDPSDHESAWHALRTAPGLDRPRWPAPMPRSACTRPAAAGAGARPPHGSSHLKAKEANARSGRCFRRSPCRRPP